MIKDAVSCIYFTPSTLGTHENTGVTGKGVSCRWRMDPNQKIGINSAELPGWDT